MTGPRNNNLEKWINSVRYFALRNPGWVILVEGLNDKMALNMHGIESVVQLRSRAYHDIAEDLSGKYEGVVILTDLDFRGDLVCKKLAKVLSMYGLKVNLGFRRALRCTGLRFVEDLRFLGKSS